MLGLAGVALALGAVVALVVIQPWKQSAAVCRYAAARVTVVITGPDCYAVMQEIADNADIPWTIATRNPGREYTRLTDGKDSIAIYDAGNQPLASGLAEHFWRARWRPVLPSALTASPGTLAIWLRACLAAC